MRATLAPLAALCVIAMAAGTARAGGVDNNNEYSGQKMRTLTRGASTEVDAAVYNPAGLTALGDGFHVSLNDLMVFDTYNQKSGDLSFEGTGRNLVVPSAFLVYKEKNWAAFFNFTIPGGGGSAKYADGSLTSLGMANMVAQGVGLAVNQMAYSMGLPVDPTSTDAQAANLTHSVEGSSMYLGFTAGGAYKVNDFLSFAVGGRVVHAVKSTTANMAFDVAGTGGLTYLPDVHIAMANQYDETANGIGGIIGLNLTPFDGLNIGLRYETITELTFQGKQVTNDVEVTSPTAEGVAPGAAAQMADTIAKQADQDGVKANRDLPPMLSVGVAYRLIPELTAEVDFDYYFNSYARWNGMANVWGRNYEAAVSLEYVVMPGLKVSAGFDYSEAGATDVYYNGPETPSYDSYAFAVGGQYAFDNGFVVDVGYTKPLYQGFTSTEGYDLSQDRNVFAIALSYTH